MRSSDVIEHFGSLSATARALGVSRQLVYTWKRKGQIPALRQFEVAQATKGRVPIDDELAALVGSRRVWADGDS